jgi:lysophospholipase L1-like esterase
MIKFSVKKNRTGLTIFILITSLIISCSPLREFRGTPEVTKWEPEIAKFEALDKTQNYPSDAIMFAGSSSIRLWSTLLTDMYPYNVIQRGYGGSKLSDYAIFSERIFSPHKCSALVLFVANDITGGENDRTPEEVRKLFSVIHNSFRKTNPGKPVFYIGITPTRSRWKAWPEIKRSNELVREWCERKSNTWYIDTEAAFLNETGEPKEELFRDDKLHLNDEGYRVWTEIIKGELDKVFQN